MTPIHLLSAEDVDIDALSDTLRDLADGIDDGTVLVDGAAGEQSADIDDSSAYGILKMKYVVGADNQDLLYPVQFTDEDNE